MKPLAECFLYGFIDTAYLDGRPVADLTACLCDNGVDLLQFRAKELPTELVSEMASKVKVVTDRFDVPLVVNDYPEIADRLGAAYCHLGQEDLTFLKPSEADIRTSSRGNSWSLGVSTHSPDQALRSIAIGASYLGVGPVYPTGTKPKAQPVTVDYVRWASTNVSLPWFAIGGISLLNLDEVLEAGAKRICVVSAILRAPDPARACRSFKNRLPSRPE